MTTDQPGTPEEPQASSYPSAPPPPPAYQPAPPATAWSSGPVTRPPSIDLAVRLMYVGAAISLLGIVFALLEKNTIHDKIAQSAATSGSTVNVDTLTNTAVAIAIVSSLIGAGLWLLMARMNAAGKNWARILSTILGGLNVLLLLFSLAQNNSSGLQLVLNVISLVLAAVIIYLLWKKESSQFYANSNAPRY